MGYFYHHPKKYFPIHSLSHVHELHFPTSSGSSLTLDYRLSNLEIVTSNPMSANPDAITFAPRSCPSCPIFATSNRGRRPSSSANSSQRPGRFNAGFDQPLVACAAVRGRPRPWRSASADGATTPTTPRRGRRGPRWDFRRPPVRHLKP